MNLLIGNKRYSSWSFRPWLLMQEAGIPFKETMIWIHKPDTYKNIRKHNPGGRVPALIDGKITVWESLAICEYLAEKFPKKQLWPKDPAARAMARSISHEMHAGFQGMRSELNCHFVNRYQGYVIPASAKADIDRVIEIWRECRRKYGKGGPFLFGKFSIADAMYAPVVFRFLAYGVPVDKVCKDYMDAIEILPGTLRWVIGAYQEKQIIPAYEKKLKLV